MRNRPSPTILLIALLIFCISPAALTANDACHKLLGEFFREQYNSSEIYECGFCFFNSGELARHIKERFGNNIDEKELNIMVIKHKDAPNPLIAEEEFRLHHSVVGLNPRKGQITGNGITFALWKYHAVLEYQGNILDLDFKDAKEAVPAKEYFEAMFGAITGDIVKAKANYPEDKIKKMRDFNQWINMHVFKIPVTEYFKRFRTRPPRENRHDLDFIWQHPGIDVWDYLEMTAPQASSKQSNQ